jgi:hypothetical protein
MGKVQDYLENKRIKESGLPTMWIVKSDRSGVLLPVKCQVINIKRKNVKSFCSSGEYYSDTYYIKDMFPYEISINEGLTSNKTDGYASGCGDLWYWTYFCSLSEKEANEYYIMELKRVKEEYLSDEKG